MATVKVLDPLTRIEGHLKIEVEIDAVHGVQQVVDAHATGTLFRGFEVILQGRPPTDAPHITQRICGVCPVSHGMAAVKALDQAGGVAIPENARILRNLVLGANFVQSHILHFYHLALMDFMEAPDASPWQPGPSSDIRIAGDQAATLMGHYVQALDMRRKAHEMGALFGGRLPMPPTYIPGGFTTTPRRSRIVQFEAYLDELIPFIEDVWLPDVELVAAEYPEYYGIGAGPANLLAYGVFDLDASGASKLLRRGRMTAGQAGVTTVDTGAIAEDVTYSWYDDSENGLNPAQGATTPQFPKDDGYSWLKAPRYAEAPFEVGPLARMWVNGDYNNGVSVLDRHWARAYEAEKIARAMRGWLSGLTTTGPVYTHYATPASAQAEGLTEAPRGALGHWVEIDQGRIAHYQVVTPTCWNASPRDGRGIRGPIEEALVGTPVQEADDPVEVVRVVHSFDPCLACAVHVARPRSGASVVPILPARAAEGG